VFTATFVGVVEIVFRTLMIIGFLTAFGYSASDRYLGRDRYLKISMLLDKGFWALAHEARTDLSMLGLLFLLIEGAGPQSIDWRLARGFDRPNRGLNQRKRERV
jgi:uncharacterized membrane protein YphA (DoxX/SURF4 family)